MVEPSQDDVTAHFRRMASGGGMSDADVQRFGRRKLGGYHNRRQNYMVTKTPLVKPPVEMTSDVVDSVNKAKSRLGRAVKLTTNLDNEPVPNRSRKRKHAHRRGPHRTKKGGGESKKRKKRHQKDTHDNGESKKKRKKKKK